MTANNKIKRSIWEFQIMHVHLNDIATLTPGIASYFLDQLNTNSIKPLFT